MDVVGPAYRDAHEGKDPGDYREVIRALDAYFGTKLKSVVEQHKEELDSQRQSNRRRANQDLRSGLIRLAHENPELRKDLLPLLKA